MHLVNMLEHGSRFGITTFLQGALQQQLSTAMLASHLAGIRRADLMFKQSVPKGTAKQPLELSFFSSVLDYFRFRKVANIAELQKKYNTLAFDVITKTSDTIKKELSGTIEKLVSEGAHVREAKKILGAKFDELGVRPASKFQLETIFRTQSQIAFAAGKWQSERHDPFIYNHLWGYRYVTAGDDRVRPAHAILDGVTLPKGDQFWQEFYPPNGWNCRCQAIPLFEVTTIVHPHLIMPGGERVRPDKGFRYNAGYVFSPLGV